ncbi:c-type cytochrome [Methylogaea oryzae]|uniref:c-type cytochrome n=1 Tax=Methylogaea oryzae TaxID=1295382 RepID=UPI000AFB03A2|nr:c-type cytochrome [Methylogaea oryzae]
MNNTPPWATEALWKKVAVWVTALSFVLLVVLTFDSMAKTAAGGSRVPAYSVVNKQIDYRYDQAAQRYKPVIGGEQPLFGKALDEATAEQQVSLGKKTVQGKNCINCHTILGNGAYYAPDLTKSWLDPAWISETEREKRMLAFLLDPEKNHVATAAPGACPTST